jgi:hypothetical protein
VIPQVTVYNTQTFEQTTDVFPLLTGFDQAQSFAMTPVTACTPVLPYNPRNNAARFRMFAASSTDGSRVYAGLCDGGTIADISTVTNTSAVNGNATDVLVTDLNAPFSAGAPQSNGEPLPQYPIFLLAGQ